MYCILGFTTQNFLQFFYASCSPLIMIELPKLKNFDGNNGNVSKNRSFFGPSYLKSALKVQIVVIGSILGPDLVHVNCSVKSKYLERNRKNISTNNRENMISHDVLSFSR